jgi:hypothetical protein
MGFFSKEVATTTAVFTGLIAAAASAWAMNRMPTDVTFW